MKKNSLTTEPSSIKVILIEDSFKMIDQVKKSLSINNDFKILKVFTSAEAAIPELENLKADLAIVDLGLPGMRGDQLILYIKEHLPKIKVVVYTVFEDEESIFSAIKAGANGYILKDTDRERLFIELKVISMGGSTITPRIAEKIINQNDTNEINQSDYSLSNRELEILNLMSLGFRYQDVADELKISLHTVRRHIEKVYRKLNVTNKTEALLKINQDG